MIQALHIDKSFGTLRVLKDICFTAAPAEVVSIVGASGAGKSTLLQILGSLSRPDAGTVRIDGTDIFALSDKALAAFRNQKIGFVFQFHHLLPEFTAVENVMVSQYYHSMPDEEEALEALERVGLRERAKHLPSQLSGGEQQRVCVARALINHPKVLFADEPTGALNSKAAGEVINDLARSTGWE